LIGPIKEENMANVHICKTLMPLEPSDEDLARVRSHRAALLLSTKWESGQTITVKFLEGEQSLKDRVAAVAREWTKPGRANLDLRFVDQGPADIRIAFVQGDGSWSYLGTDCRNIPANQPTMNYGWLTPASPEDELRRVVLHEFGHALGLIHEHQNPKKPISWNKPAVYADLGGPPNNWSKATIDNNMFKAYKRKKVAATNVDPDSIMMYPIPASWTTNGFSADLNGELSPLDEALIANQYP
jgi:serralysin